MAGAPKVTRELVRVFWRARIAGASVASASALVGVSETCGLRWIYKSGGMVPDLGQPSGRYLSLADRAQIAVGWQLGMSKSAIARMIERHPSTVGRELERNQFVAGRYPKQAVRPGAVRRGPRRPRHVALRYQASSAQYKAEQRARRPKQGKLASNPELHAQVQHRLRKRWSPEQITASLRSEFAERPEIVRCPTKPSTKPSTCKDAVNYAGN